MSCCPCDRIFIDSEVLNITSIVSHHRSLNSDPEGGGRAPAAGQGQSGELPYKNSFETKLDFKVGLGESVF